MQDVHVYHFNHNYTYKPLKIKPQDSSAQESVILLFKQFINEYWSSQ